MRTAVDSSGSTETIAWPELSTAVRNDRYKVIRNETLTYDTASDSCGPVVTNEFYEIDQAVPTPKLDNPDLNLLLAPLSADLQNVCAQLTAKLDELLASEPACPGDGNKDGVVDLQDLQNVHGLVTDWGFSSVYDFAVDGLTTSADSQVVLQNMGTTCPRGHAVY